MKTLIKMSGAVAALCLASSALALNIYAPGLIPLADDDLASHGITTEVNWAITAVEAWNGQNGGSQIPSLVGVAYNKEDGSPQPSLFEVPEGCEWLYVLQKIGNGNESPDVILSFLRPGDTLVAQRTLSHNITWCGGERVPDGGTTAILLGVGLIGLGVTRRRLGA